MKRLPQSHHSSVDTAIETSTSTPPMVGVPALTKWVCGPMVRTAWPTFSSVSLRITHGPNASPIRSAVRLAITARKVR